MERTILKLNEQGSFGIVIPKSFCETGKLEKGERVEVRLKSADPWVINIRRSELKR